MLLALAEDPGAFLSTCSLPLTFACNRSSRGSDAPYWLLCAPAQVYTYIYTHTHKNKSKKHVRRVLLLSSPLLFSLCLTFSFFLVSLLKSFSAASFPAQTDSQHSDAHETVRGSEWLDRGWVLTAGFFTEL